MACYDVDVDVDDPAKPHMTSFFQGVSQTREIQDLDAKVRRSSSNECQIFSFFQITISVQIIIEFE